MALRVFSAFLLIALVPVSFATAQKKADRIMIAQLQADIGYLASDELEGRRTGTKGEGIAADYIIKRYREMGIPPYKKDYLYPFGFVYGKEISGVTMIRINNMLMRINDDAFPLPFSPSMHLSGSVIPDANEQGNIWMAPLYKDQDQANNAHYDAEKYMYEQTKELEKQGATGVIFYDEYGSKWAPVFNAKSPFDPSGIPVVFLNNNAYQKYVATSGKNDIPVVLDILINKTERTGSNIAAYIDNGAKYTVIIGAHYDHLGYGEDGNSHLANAVKEHQVHHGADDNASGTAAVLQMAQWIKKNKKKAHNYNYLFLNFSGEELGLFGSKSFVKDQGIDSSLHAYMINMDMVGRLNDSTHALELGGVGTSPAWNDVAELAGNEFKLTIDSSGVGPSDHTSFYHAGIPVLFLFTLQHKDYHKPTDIASLINYTGEAQIISYVSRIVAKEDKENSKPRFTPTKQKLGGRSTFKVSLGVMPDYTYQGDGLRVDGVTDNRPAMKAGVLPGDIITKLGDNKINGMQSYMEALGKFAPGDKTNVTINRGDKKMVLPLELTGK